MLSRANGFQALVGAALIVAVSGVAAAQQATSSTSTQMGKSETTTTSRTISADVVSVDGNKVVARDARGVAKEYTLPDGFKFQVDGRDVPTADLKPGMHVTATITTTVTSTPVTVTEIRKGTVLAVMGNTIIVRNVDGVRKFTQEELDQRHVKLMRAGQPAQVMEFREGDVFTAVIVTDHPPQVVSDRELKAMAHPAPAPAHTAHAAAPAAEPAAEPAPAAAKTLPKTASQVPLVGLTGALLLAVGLALTASRRFRLSR